jgi:Sodium/hydrogen exchanger family
MPDVSFSSLAVVLGVAFAAPLVLGLVPRLRIPAVVLEIVLGIVVGPQVLGWAKVDQPVQILAPLLALLRTCDTEPEPSADTPAGTEDSGPTLDAM